MLLQWNSKLLFSRLTESCRTVLLITLSGAVAASKASLGLKMVGGAISPVDDPLTQPAFLSFTQDPTIPTVDRSSFARPALGGPGTTRRKRGRKKVHLLPDRIADENKTPQLKAFESFVMKYHSQLDDVDLSGGEDPIILHYVIVSHPSTVAHKEVLKFKRRPQYLEMLVHLVNMTLAKGHHDRVMEWLAEGFQWLSKRNEVLLNPRVTQKLAGEHAVSGKGKLAKASHLFSAVPSKIDLKKSSQKALGPVHSSSAGGKHSRDHVTSGSKGKDHLASSEHLVTKGKKPSTSSIKAPLTVARREPMFSGGREFYIRHSLRHSLAAELSSQIRITKEDLEAKSVYIIIMKLPDMWRIHRCR